MLDLQGNHLLSLGLLGADSVPPKPGARAHGDHVLPQPPSPPRKGTGEAPSGWLALPPAAPSTRGAASAASSRAGSTMTTGSEHRKGGEEEEEEDEQKEADGENVTPGGMRAGDLAVTVGNRSNDPSEEQGPPLAPSRGSDKEQSVADASRLWCRRKARMDWKVVQDSSTGERAYFNKRTGRM